MFTVSVSREFPAQHYLTVPNPGPEGTLHTHQFTVTVTLQGETLNEHGYLVDIDEVNTALTEIENRYRDTTLNELPEINGNPSVERFAREIAARMRTHLEMPLVTHLQVTIHEDETAAGSFSQDL